MQRHRKTEWQERNHHTFRWYRDRTTDRVFTQSQYPLTAGRGGGVNLCTYHGNNMVHKQLVEFDHIANDYDRPTECWMCQHAQSS